MVEPRSFNPEAQRLSNVLVIIVLILLRFFLPDGALPRYHILGKSSWTLVHNKEYKYNRKTCWSVLTTNSDGEELD